MPRSTTKEAPPEPDDAAPEEEVGVEEVLADLPAAPPDYPDRSGDASGLTQTRVVPISSIHESKTNPRKISKRAVEVVALSLARFGWKQPIVVDAEMEIVVGHTRHRAALSRGVTEVPIVVADDLTPAEIDAYRIADNRSRDFTTWDLPLLADQLEVLSDDFSDVLALSDWESVISEFEEASKTAAEVDLPAEAVDALTGGFQVTVHFHSKEEALAAEAAMIELPGAFDVRHEH